MSSTKPSRYRGLIVLVACLPSLSFSAAPASGFPTPGLYQMSESRSTRDRFKDGLLVRSWQSHVEGATGGESIRHSGGGKAPVSQHFSGQGPVTTCIPKESSDPVPFLSEDGCTSKNAVTTAAGTTFRLSCPNLQLEVIVRRMDSNTWEYELSTTSGPGPHASSNSAAEKIMEHAARKAATASERKEAADALRMLRQARAEEAREAAKAPPVDNSFPDEVNDTVDKTRSIWRLTRIADKCPAASNR